MSRFDEITDGRVLSGRQAQKAGLVDQVGNRKDAIMKAALLGGIEAGSADDVRLCPIATSASGGGLFDMQSTIARIQAGAGTPSLSYK
jgi:ClpP class serine protease